MLKLFLIKTTLVSIVVAQSFLTITEIADFINCINSGGNKYNYTTTENGELILQPYEIREFDYDGIDSHITDCYISQRHSASFAMSGNIESEPDLENSVILDASSINTLYQWGWARMKSITHNNNYVVNTTVSPSLVTSRLSQDFYQILNVKDHKSKAFASI